MQRPTVAVLGAGSLGEIFAQGLLRAGWAADDLVLVSRRQARADDLARQTGISSVTDVVSGVEGRDVIVISVKPKDIASVIDSIRDHVTADQTVVCPVQKLSYNNIHYNPHSLLVRHIFWAGEPYSDKL